jgi:hypothetical protein
MPLYVVTLEWGVKDGGVVIRPRQFWPTAKLIDCVNSSTGLVMVI